MKEKNYNLIWIYSNGLLFPLEMHMSSFAGSDVTDRRVLIRPSLMLVPVTCTEVQNVQDTAVNSASPFPPVPHSWRIKNHCSNSLTVL